MGVSTIFPSPFGGTSNADLLRKAAESRRKGATSAVESIQINPCSVGTAVITWSNCEGEGMDVSRSRENGIRTASEEMFAACNIAANKVCLSLQCHTDLQKHPRPNAAGSVPAQTRDLHIECSWKRSRTAIEFCRAHFHGLESIRGSSREFQVWARCGRFQVWRTIALALPNSQMWSIQRPGV